MQWLQYPNSCHQNRNHFAAGSFPSMEAPSLEKTLTGSTGASAETEARLQGLVNELFHLADMDNNGTIQSTCQHLLWNNATNGGFGDVSSEVTFCAKFFLPKTKQRPTTSKTPSTPHLSLLIPRHVCYCHLLPIICIYMFSSPRILSRSGSRSSSTITIVFWRCAVIPWEELKS